MAVTTNACFGALRGRMYRHAIHKALPQATGRARGRIEAELNSPPLSGHEQYTLTAKELVNEVDATDRPD